MFTCFVPPYTHTLTLTLTHTLTLSHSCTHTLYIQVLFAKGMRQFGKNFHKIKKELLPKKEIVSYL